jgi:hypothetical protein
MGGCPTCGEKNRAGDGHIGNWRKPTETIGDNHLSFNRDVSINIKLRSKKGNVIGHEPVDFLFHPPQIAQANAYNLNKPSPTILQVSACVLPGIDPRGILPKE